MTIDEAINDLIVETQFEQDEENLTMVEALRLGIEALKRILDSRVAGWNPINRTLPGETAE